MIILIQAVQSWDYLYQANISMFAVVWVIINFG